MRFVFLMVIAIPLAIGCSADSDIPQGAESILANISDPQFRESEYDATELGVVADGVTDCCLSINEAIAKCSAEGGGRVNLPEGTVFCAGSINLRSNVNLHLPKGCELLFSGVPADFLPPVLTTWEGTRLYNYSPMIRSEHCTNIAITGGGVINGNAELAFAAMTGLRKAQQDSLRSWGCEGVPVGHRCFGERSLLAPNMIEPKDSKNVLIEGVTVKDSPFWVIHPLFCDNVTVRNVTIDSYNHNNDGCDPEMSTNVLIEGCVFNTGDDAVAIKAGRDQEGWRIGKKTCGIVIRNCEFSSRCNGLCIGSEMSGGIENVFMYNVHIGLCSSAIYFKSNSDRGGYVRDVCVNNIAIDSVRTAFVRFETNYPGGRGGFFPSVFENFTIRNVTGGSSRECGFYAVGIEGHPIKNVRLENVVFATCNKTPYLLNNAEGVVFKNVIANGGSLPENPSDTGEIKLMTF